MNSAVIYISIILIIIILILICINLYYSVTTYNELINDKNQIEDAIQNIKKAECLLKETNMIIENCNPCNEKKHCG